MNTKLKRVIEQCKKSTIEGTCNTCSCSERECLEYLNYELSDLEIDEQK